MIRDRPDGAEKGEPADSPRNTSQVTGGWIPSLTLTFEMKIHKKRWIILGASVAGIILAPFVIPAFSPWSGINCEYQDINIKTGQARYSRSLWFVKVSERVEDTPLSLALNGETVDVAPIKEWHRVNTFSPGVHHSPHHLFHGALHQAREFDLLQRMYELNQTSRTNIARQLLIRWQNNGSYFATRRFLHDKMMELEQTSSGAVPKPAPEQ